MSRGGPDPDRDPPTEGETGSEREPHPDDLIRLGPVDPDDPGPGERKPDEEKKK